MSANAQSRLVQVYDLNVGPSRKEMKQRTSLGWAIGTHDKSKQIGQADSNARPGVKLNRGLSEATPRQVEMTPESEGNSSVPRKQADSSVEI